MNALTTIRQDGRVGYWMHVASGTKFYPCDPRESEINIADIAHHLALQSRFNGATAFQDGTPAFYSVAEHSVHVYHDVLNHIDFNAVSPREIVEIQFAALLHDAAEAYLGDIIRPLKMLPELGGPYKQIEERLERVIAKRFELAYPWHPAIKKADEAVVTAEMEQIILHANKGHLHESSKRAPTRVNCWSPPVAKEVFLTIFDSLLVRRTNV